MRARYPAVFGVFGILTRPVRDGGRSDQAPAGRHQRDPRLIPCALVQRSIGVTDRAECALRQDRVDGGRRRTAEPVVRRTQLAVAVRFPQRQEPSQRLVHGRTHVRDRSLLALRYFAAHGCAR